MRALLALFWVLEVVLIATDQTVAGMHLVPKAATTLQYKFAAIAALSLLGFGFYCLGLYFRKQH